MFRYVREGVDVLAATAPTLNEALDLAHRKAFVILDGTLLPIESVAMASGHDRAFYSGKHKRHGVNVQVLADPAGRLVWASPALPGARHDLGAARGHGLIDGLNAAEVRAVADTACQGGGPAIRVPQRRRRVDPDTGRFRRPVPGAEGGQRRPRPPAWSRRAGERPNQVLEDPRPDPQLPHPSNEPRQSRDGPDPDQLRSSWKGLS